MSLDESDPLPVHIIYTGGVRGGVMPNIIPHLEDHIRHDPDTNTSILIDPGSRHLKDLVLDQSQSTPLILDDHSPMSSAPLSSQFTSASQLCPFDEVCSTLTFSEYEALKYSSSGGCSQRHAQIEMIRDRLGGRRNTLLVDTGSYHWGSLYSTSISALCLNTAQYDIINIGGYDLYDGVMHLSTYLDALHPSIDIVSTSLELVDPKREPYLVTPRVNAQQYHNRELQDKQQLLFGARGSTINIGGGQIDQPLSDVSSPTVSFSPPLVSPMLAPFNGFDSLFTTPVRPKQSNEASELNTSTWWDYQRQLIQTQLEQYLTWHTYQREHPQLAYYSKSLITPFVLRQVNGVSILILGVVPSSVLGFPSASTVKPNPQNSNDFTGNILFRIEYTIFMAKEQQKRLSMEEARYKGYLHELNNLDKQQDSVSQDGQPPDGHGIDVVLLLTDLDYENALFLAKQARGVDIVTCYESPFQKNTSILMSNANSNSTTPAHQPSDPNTPHPPTPLSSYSSHQVITSLYKTNVVLATMPIHNSQMTVNTLSIHVDRETRRIIIPEPNTQTRQNQDTTGEAQPSPSHRPPESNNEPRVNSDDLFPMFGPIDPAAGSNLSLISSPLLSQLIPALPTDTTFPQGPGGNNLIDMANMLKGPHGHGATGQPTSLSALESFDTPVLSPLFPLALSQRPAPQFTTLHLYEDQSMRSNREYNPTFRTQNIASSSFPEGELLHTDQLHGNLLDSSRETPSPLKTAHNTNLLTSGRFLVTYNTTLQQRTSWPNELLVAKQHILYASHELEKSLNIVVGKISLPLLLTPSQQHANLNNSPRENGDAPDTMASPAQQPFSELIPILDCYHYDCGLARLVVSSYRYACIPYTGTLCDIAFVNMGSIRGSLYGPHITMENILRVLPFGNMVFVIQLNGQDVKRAVQYSISQLGTKAFAQSNLHLTYSVKTGIPPSERIIEVKLSNLDHQDPALYVPTENSQEGADPSTSRRNNLKFHDIFEHTMYTVALPAFMFYGGDGYSMFEGATILSIASQSSPSSVTTPQSISSQPLGSPSSSSLSLSHTPHTPLHQPSEIELLLRYIRAHDIFMSLPDSTLHRCIFNTLPWLTVVEPNCYMLPTQLTAQETGFCPTNVDVCMAIDHDEVLALATFTTSTLPSIHESYILKSSSAMNTSLLNTSRSSVSGRQLNEFICNNCSGLGACQVITRQCECFIPSAGVLKDLPIVRGEQCDEVAGLWQLPFSIYLLLISFCIATILICICCALCILYHGHHPSIRAISPRFGITTCLAGILAAVSAGLFISHIRLNIPCMILPWILSTSYIILFGSLILRTYRLHKIFNIGPTKQHRSQLQSYRDQYSQNPQHDNNLPVMPYQRDHGDMQGSSASPPDANDTSPFAPQEHSIIQYPSHPPPSSSLAPYQTRPLPPPPGFPNIVPTPYQDHSHESIANPIKQHGNTHHTSSSIPHTAIQEGANPIERHCAPRHQVEDMTIDINMKQIYSTDDLNSQGGIETDATLLMLWRAIFFSDLDLYKRLGGILLINLLILLAFNIADPLKLTGVLLNSSQFEITLQCQTKTSIPVILLLIYDGAILAWGMYLAFVTRNVAEAFNESTQVGAAIYNCAFVAFILLLLQLIVNERAPMITNVLVVVGILYVVIFTLGVIYIPRFWHIRTHRHSIVTVSNNVTTTTPVNSPSRSTYTNPPQTWQHTEEQFPSQIPSLHKLPPPASNLVQPRIPTHQTRNSSEALSSHTNMALDMNSRQGLTYDMINQQLRALGIVPGSRLATGKPSVLTSSAIDADQTQTNTPQRPSDSSVNEMPPSASSPKLNASITTMVLDPSLSASHSHDSSSLSSTTPLPPEISSGSCHLTGCDSDGDSIPSSNHSSSPSPSDDEINSILREQNFVNPLFLLKVQRSLDPQRTPTQQPEPEDGKMHFQNYHSHSRLNENEPNHDSLTSSIMQHTPHMCPPSTLYHLPTPQNIPYAVSYPYTGHSTGNASLNPSPLVSGDPSLAHHMSVSHIWQGAPQFSYPHQQTAMTPTPITSFDSHPPSGMNLTRPPGILSQHHPYFAAIPATIDPSLSRTPTMVAPLNTSRSFVNDYPIPKPMQLHVAPHHPHPIQAAHPHLMFDGTQHASRRDSNISHLTNLSESTSNPFIQANNRFMLKQKKGTGKKNKAVRSQFVKRSNHTPRSGYSNRAQTPSTTSSRHRAVYPPLSARMNQYEKDHDHIPSRKHSSVTSASRNHQSPSSSNDTS